MYLFVKKLFIFMKKCIIMITKLLKGISMKSSKLFSSMFGSRLYGTQTPTSDIDWKHIVLPSLDHLLLGRGVDNKVKKTNNVKNVRNGVDDVDEEFIPIQVFAKHFMEGQTYAIELAFAIEGNHASQKLWYYDPSGISDKQETYTGSIQFHDFIAFVKELRTKFLTSNIKAMMGYVVNQANLYSFKGERLNVARELKDLFMKMNHQFGTLNGTTSDFASAFSDEIADLIAKYPKYFRADDYDIGSNRRAPCFVILEKTLPFTNSIEHSLKVLDALISKYGSRAGQASENNVDWKATMHAVRIVDEGIDLLKNHKLTFPFNSDYAARLLQIKRGELPLDPIKEELAVKLEMLKELEKTTTLPDYDQELRDNFDEWLAGWMRRFYKDVCA